MADEQPNPNRVNIRRDRVLHTLETVLDKFRAEGLTPPEGLMVAELLLWQLIDNLLKLAPASAVEKLRATALRGIVRLESRIQAWPAKIEDRQ